MIVGYVVRSQTPMLFTFDEEHTEFVCEVLGESIVMAHNVYDMFQDREDEVSEWW